MARFTQVPQNFLFRKLLEYWGNMVRNYGENCRDDDFFAVANINFDHDRGVELIQVAYTANELEEKNVAARQIEDLKQRDDAYRDEILPAMAELRSHVDDMERVCGKDYWPVPSYNDMLFYV